MTRFIDRSNVNGADNYKAAGITHIYLKASEGTTFVDSTYAGRKSEAKAAGATVGAYHFAGHGDPIAEANHFLSVIRTPHAGHMRPCLDLESGQSATWADAFLRHLHAQLGYWPVLYGSTSTIPAIRNASSAAKACPWWRAEYGPNDGGRHALQGGDMGASAHQYTSVATFPGISGHTDASVFLSATGQKEMMVPVQLPVFKRPKGAEVTYHRRDGSQVTRRYRGLGWFQLRHPRAWWRGGVTSKPIHK
jgi:lysozyme